MVGIGDAGARAIALARQRLQTLLGDDKTPGVAFFVLVGDDSLTVSQSADISDRLRVDVEGLVAEELISTGRATARTDIADIIGPDWLGNVSSPEPGLAKRLCSKEQEHGKCIDRAIGTLEDKLYEAARSMNPAEFEEFALGVQHVVDNVVGQKASLALDQRDARQGDNMGSSASGSPDISTSLDEFLKAVRSLSARTAAVVAEAGAARGRVERMMSDSLSNGTGISIGGLAGLFGRTAEQVASDIGGMARSICSAIGGVLGIARDENMFGSQIESTCSEWLTQLKPDDVLWTDLGELQRTRFQEFGPGEFVVLPMQAEPSQPIVGPTRRAARLAFFGESTSGKITRQLDNAIARLASPSSVVSMQSAFSRIGLNAAGSPLRIRVVADLADTVAGELLQDVVGLALQICNTLDITADVTGVALVPQPLAGLKSAAAPQARAYASLKEIYHFGKEGKYFRSTDHLSITAPRRLFDSLYVVQSPCRDPQESAQLAAEPLAHFLTMLCLDDSGQGAALFGQNYGECRVNSFGLGRLVYPAAVVQLYHSLRISGGFAEMATEAPVDSPIDGWVPPARPGGSLFDTIAGSASPGGRTGPDRFRLGVDQWLVSTEREINESLDAGPIRTRLSRAYAISNAAIDEVKRLLPWAAGGDISDLLRRQKELSGTQSHIRGDLRNGNRGRLMLTSIAGLSLLAVAAPFALPAILPVLGSTASAALAVSAGTALGNIIAVTGTVGTVTAGGLALARSKHLGTQRVELSRVECELNSVTKRLDRTLSVRDFRLVHLAIVCWRLMCVKKRISDLYDVLAASRGSWFRRAESVAGGLPLDRLEVGAAGRVLLISRPFLQRELARVADTVLTDSCDIRLSGFLGRSSPSVRQYLPVQAADAITESRSTKSSVVDVLSDMATANEGVTAFLSALLEMSRVALPLNEAVLDGGPTPLMALCLGDTNAASEAPLDGWLTAVGINPVAGELALLSGADDCSMVLAQSWNEPVGIPSLLSLPTYFDSYLDIGCCDAVTGDIQRHRPMRDIVPPPPGRARKVMAQCLALGLLRLPGLAFEGTDAHRTEAAEPIDAARAMLSTLERDPGRVVSLEELTTQLCKDASARDIAAWLEWVADTPAWWENVLGLTALDLGYIADLARDLRLGIIPGGCGV